MVHEGSAKTYKQWCWYNLMLRGTCNLFSSSHCSPDLSGLHRNQVWIEILNSQIYPCSDVCSNVAAKGGKYDISPEATAKRRDAQANNPHQPHRSAQYIELQHVPSNPWDYNDERTGYSGNMMGTSWEYTGLTTKVGDSVLGSSCLR